MPAWGIQPYKECFRAGPVNTQQPISLHIQYATGKGMGLTAASRSAISHRNWALETQSTIHTNAPIQYTSTDNTTNHPYPTTMLSCIMMPNRAPDTPHHALLPSARRMYPILRGSPTQRNLVNISSPNNNSTKVCITTTHPHRTYMRTLVRAMDFSASILETNPATQDTGKVTPSKALRPPHLHYHNHTVSHPFST